MIFAKYSAHVIVTNLVNNLSDFASCVRTGLELRPIPSWLESFSFSVNFIVYFQFYTFYQGTHETFKLI